ncbi:uncharacterized protein EV420DRAFT_1571773 [Desarmillaria tabescens]|uniref:DUF6534 domain-containing protein n=1 Tax=Armillaria tabescens TaxID=1929756 RepID=A0AA39JMY2_ARMTA|nr:uncharacterized protein EV420DRAFT_1571773 [Desarmillaria tabescens]KAK0445598.1 hypothetical protein EV420DRAFT_1571773 [Desarmillaria tabescens]
MSPYPSLDNTLGALYIGATLAVFLFGLTSLAAVIYFFRCSNDWWFHRYSVALLWALDAFHAALTTHLLYFYFVKHFGDFAMLDIPVWSFKLQSTIKMLIVIWVQGLYAIRLWKLGRHFPKTLPWLVFLAVGAVFGVGIFSLRYAYIAPRLSDLRNEKAAVYAIFCVIPTSDFIIAISMCYYLYQMRTVTSHSKMATLLLLLMRFILVSGMATSTCSLLSLITYIAWPDSLIFFAFDFVLPKLYINSLLAMFITRKDHQTQFLGTDCNSATPTPIVFRKTSEIHGNGRDETVCTFPRWSARGKSIFTRF